MPLGQEPRALVTVPSRWSPDAVRTPSLVPRATGVERVQVSCRRNLVSVRTRNIARRSAARAGLLLADLAEPRSGPAVTGFPPDQLRRGAVRRMPRNSRTGLRSLSHSSVCRSDTRTAPLHGIVGAEVVVSRSRQARAISCSTAAACRQSTSSERKVQPRIKCQPRGQVNRQRSPLSGDTPPVARPEYAPERAQVANAVAHLDEHPIRDRRAPSRPATTTGWSGSSSAQCVPASPA